MYIANAWRGMLIVVSAVLTLDAHDTTAQSVRDDKPVQISREWVTPNTPQSWEALVERAGLIVEGVVVDASSGEVPYYGSGVVSVVTANSLRVTRVLAVSSERNVVPGSKILVLTPGGKIDRGEYIEHVIVLENQPLLQGSTYLIALEWVERLQAWRPVAFHETVFRVLDDGTVATRGNGPVAREVRARKHFELQRTIEATARRLGKGVSAK